MMGLVLLTIYAFIAWLHDFPYYIIYARACCVCLYAAAADDGDDDDYDGR